MRMRIFFPIACPVSSVGKTQLPECLRGPPSQLFAGISKIDILYVSAALEVYFRILGKFVLVRDILLSLSYASLPCHAE
jgi:hypothetical protein